jgi:hypothetical protein
LRDELRLRVEPELPLLELLRDELLRDDVPDLRDELPPLRDDDADLRVDDEPPLRERVDEPELRDELLFDDELPLRDRDAEPELRDDDEPLRERDDEDEERDDERDRDDEAVLRSFAGISALTTSFVSFGICFATKSYMRCSSRRMPFASFTVSLSPTCSASAMIAV